MVKKLFPVLTLGLLLSGCGTMITNLTPKQQFRNDNGFYQVETALRSDQQTLRGDSIKPSVVVGQESFPMRPTPFMTNRWETLVPVPAANNVLYYRFKFDFKYNDFGAAPKPDSKMSPIYRMQISPQQ
jgi:hypothetical protein